MKPSVIGALTGAAIGFVLVMVLKLAVVQSVLLNDLFFPGRAIIVYANRGGMGDFGLMIFDFFAYFSNIILYAAIGFAVGRLLDRKGTA